MSISMIEMGLDHIWKDSIMLRIFKEGCYQQGLILEVAIGLIYQGL